MLRALCEELLLTVGILKQGEQQIREHLVKMLALKPKISNKVLQTIVAGNVAMVFSEWHLKGTSEQGEPIDVPGQSFNVLTRQVDGAWLITIDSPYGKSVFA